VSRLFDAVFKAGGEAAQVLRPAATDGAEFYTTPAGAGTDVPTGPAPEPASSIRPGEAVAGGRRRRVSVRAPRGGPVFPFHDGSNRAAEQYRIIRTKIAHNPRNPRMILVSSPGPGDGKTTTAINLAAALALNPDVEVLLIDADLRRSSIAGLLGVPAAPGVEEVLRNSASLDEAAVQIEQLPNLHVLPACVSLLNPAELFASAAWAELAASARSRFHYVIVDCPPVNSVADYELIEAKCDAVIVVIRPDQTNRTACQEALQSVPRERLAGVLLNCVEDWFLWRSRADSYYYYHGPRKTAVSR
jgi:capsular exopolysaccharide synthesis family protein